MYLKYVRLADNLFRSLRPKPFISPLHFRKQFNSNQNHRKFDSFSSKSKMFGNRKAVCRYFLFGAGLTGFAYFSLRRFSSGSTEDQIKLSVAAIISSGIGFLGYRYIRIAHCDTDRSKDDELDKTLREVKKKRDQLEADVKRKADELHADIKRKVDEIENDIKGAIDEKTEKLWEMVKEKYITQALMEAFEFVDNIMENLKDFAEYDNCQFKTPLIINLALLKKAQYNLVKQRLESLPKQSQADINLFEDHKHLANFAFQIYDASWKTSREGQARLFSLDDPKDILYSRFEDTDDDHCPKFALLVDKKSKSVVLAIRGTFSITDVIIDIICDDEEFLNGYAHRGILRGMRKILNELGRSINDAMEANPGYKLVITGHSLGAGTAQLLAMEILSHPGKYIPRKTKVECIALAPPPIYRSTKPVPKKVKDAIHIYINNQDCVPRMSLGSIAVLIAMIKAVDALPYTNYEKLQLLIATNPEQEIQEKLDELEYTVSAINQNRFPYLEHPGQIHYIYKIEETKDENSDLDGKYLVVKEETKWFSRQILILERMVLDHLKDYYTDALKNAKVEK